MKKTIIVGLLILMLAMMLTGYAEELPEEKTMMQMKINDTPVTVTWEENESVDALKEQYHVSVDKRKIELAETIRTVGDSAATVKLYPEISAKMTVRVTAQEA